MDEREYKEWLSGLMSKEQGTRKTIQYCTIPDSQRGIDTFSYSVVKFDRVFPDGKRGVILTWLTRERNEDITRIRNNQERHIRAYHIANEKAQFDKDSFSWYYIAHQVINRVIPARDKEDILQEIMLKYVARKPEDEFLLWLMAKETVVQYYRRGKIEDRSYRNILLTRLYYEEKPEVISYTYTTRAGKTVTVTKRVRKTTETVIHTKYDESELAEQDILIPLEALDGVLGDEGKTIEMAIDRVFFKSLPFRIREIMQKREDGFPLTVGERVTLCRYAKKCRENFSLSV